MKKSSETILFFGNERLATGISSKPIVLPALVEAGYKIAAIVANYKEAKSRNKQPLEIQDIALKHSIPLLLPSKLDRSVVNQVKSYGAKMAVLVAYGNLIPKEVIDIFPRGIINIHPSLLPLHRGSTPIESVILEGDKKTGVTIMQLSEQMDAGPVFGQSELLLKGNETKQELADNLLEVGKSMLIELLPGIFSGQITALPQDDKHATYDRLLSKADGEIDWNKPARLIEREIRAFEGWPRSQTKLAGQDITITKAKCIETDGKAGKHIIDKGRLMIFCGKGSLEVLELIPAGKKRMPISAFLAGYKNRL